jgi:hypothetical protein
LIVKKLQNNAVSCGHKKAQNAHAPMIRNQRKQRAFWATTDVISNVKFQISKGNNLDESSAILKSEI